MGPQRFVTLTLYIRAIEIFLLTYLLTYLCKLLVGTEGLLKTVSFKKIMEDM